MSAFPEILKRLTRDVVLYGLGSATTKMILIFLVPILTRSFTPSEFGVVDLISSAVIALSILMGANLDSALMRYYYCTGSETEKKAILSTNLLTIVLSSSLVSLIFIFFTKELSVSFFKNAVYADAITAAICTMPLNLCKSHILVVLRLQQKALIYALLTIVDAGCTVCITYFSIVFFQLGIAGVFVSMIVASVLVNTLGFLTLRRSYSFTFSKFYLEKLFSYCLPTIPGLIAMWSLDYGNRYFLYNFASSEEVGLFSLSFKICSIISMFIVAFRLAWDPISLSIMDKPEAKDVYSKIFNYYIVFTLIVAGVLNIFSDKVIVMFASDVYLKAAPLIGFVALAPILQGAIVIMTIGVSISEKTSILSYAYVLGALVSTITNMILIPRFGSIGAVVAMVSGYFVILGCIYIISKRYYPIKWKIRRNCSLIICYLIFVMLNLSLFANIIAYKPGVGLKTIFCAVFCLILFLLAVDKKDVVYLKRLIISR